MDKIIFFIQEYQIIYQQLILIQEIMNKQGKDLEKYLK